MQVFRPRDGSPAFVGVVGALQLDVLQNRLAAEYGLDIHFEHRRIPVGALDRGADRKNSMSSSRPIISRSPKISTATRSSWRAAFICDYTRERAPGMAFTDIKDVKKAK